MANVMPQNDALQNLRDKVKRGHRSFNPDGVKELRAPQGDGWKILQFTAADGRVFKSEPFRPI